MPRRHVTVNTYELQFPWINLDLLGPIKQGHPFRQYQLQQLQALRRQRRRDLPIRSSHPMRYTVVLEQEEDGGYVASVPALPG